MDDKLPNDEPWVEIAIVLDKYHRQHGEAARALYNMGYRRAMSAQAPGMEAMLTFGDGVRAAAQMVRNAGFDKMADKIRTLEDAALQAAERVKK